MSHLLEVAMSGTTPCQLLLILAAYVVVPLRLVYGPTWSSTRKNASRVPEALV